ncbi:MAG: hypothetical protein M1833_001662 [Piccolia ochrophora]|nr:MAG: hypothetical protein M1833_001662 [Piccolia ochrophora]
MPASDVEVPAFPNPPVSIGRLRPEGSSREAQQANESQFLSPAFGAPRWGHFITVASPCSSSTRVSDVGTSPASLTEIAKGHHVGRNATSKGYHAVSTADEDSSALDAQSESASTLPLSLGEDRQISPPSHDGFKQTTLQEANSDHMQPTLPYDPHQFYLQWDDRTRPREWEGGPYHETGLLLSPPDEDQHHVMDPADFCRPFNAAIKSSLRAEDLVDEIDLLSCSSSTLSSLVISPREQTPSLNETYQSCDGSATSHFECSNIPPDGNGDIPVQKLNSGTASHTQHVKNRGGGIACKLLGDGSKLDHTCIPGLQEGKELPEQEIHTGLREMSPAQKKAGVECIPRPMNMSLRIEQAREKHVSPRDGAETGNRRRKSTRGTSSLTRTRPGRIRNGVRKKIAPDGTTGRNDLNRPGVSWMNQDLVQSEDTRPDHERSSYGIVKDGNVSRRLVRSRKLKHKAPGILNLSVLCPNEASHMGPPSPTDSQVTTPRRSGRERKEPDYFVPFIGSANARKSSDEADNAGGDNESTNTARPVAAPPVVRVGRRRTSQATSPTPLQRSNSNNNNKNNSHNSPLVLPWPKGFTPWASLPSALTSASPALGGASDEDFQLTNLTLTRAKEFSRPRPGSELIKIVKDAQENGRCHESYDPAVVYCCRGVYMVPPKCDRCVERNTFCSRALPCQECASNSLACQANKDLDSLSHRIMVTARVVFTATFKAGTEAASQLNINLRLGQTTVCDVNIPQISRALPIGHPPVWAQYRQELCDTLPYYRAYESGCYVKDGLAYGFMLGKTTIERPYIDQDIVITRAGGGMMTEDGILIQVKDHSADEPMVSSFLNNMHQKVPIVLILGKANTDCQVEPPYPFCVMDYFQVTDVWPEMIHGKVCYMFRFEKLHLAETSWWAPVGSPNPPTVECTTDTSAAACLAFWMLDGVRPPAKLHYASRFLRKRSTWDSRIKPAWPLTPPLLRSNPGNDAPYSISRFAWKGLCASSNCGFIYKIEHSVIAPRALLNGHDAEYQGHAIPLDKFMSPIAQSIRFTDNYRIHTYNIPQCGVVSHFMANDIVNKRPDGPDDMFMWLQREDIGLKRFPMSQSKVSMTHTNHFAVNYGMPYKYVVAVDSQGFDQAPKQIIKALHRLTWAGKEAVKEEDFRNFNELLTIGYFDEQKIGFHDDGETTLGPTIATLSLGSPAVMHLRLKQKHFLGMTKANVLETKNEPVPGCLLYEERKALFDARKNLSEEQLNLRVENLKARLKMEFKSRRNAPIALSMQLKHGDIVIMHGAEMQKYYEHAVIPSGFRFALTCRYVNPELIPEEQRSKGNFVTSTDDVYDGDEAEASLDDLMRTGLGADDVASEPESILTDLSEVERGLQDHMELD